MFHVIITLIYIVPNIYLFFRIRSLFISKSFYWLYTVIYLMLALFYPITQTFEHRQMNLAMQAVSVVANYLLPFFLYLFLSMLVFDLFLLMNKLTGIVSPNMRKSFTFRFYSLLSILVVSVGVVIVGVINLNSIRVSKYRVEIPALKSKTDHLRIVFVSDIHIQQNLRAGFIRQYLRKVNALQPDLVLYGGDIIEGGSQGESRARIERIMRQVKSRYGVFGVPGNHEYYGGNGQTDFYRESGITLLQDTILKIDSICYLAGRKDAHTGKRKTLIQLFRNCEHDLPVILLDHRPTELHQANRTITDVQFSGHTHNGQLFPINLITRSLYELNSGYLRIGDTHFFVSSGLRLWGPPVKTAGKAEILLVDLDLI